jgi:hypothetical protein
MSYVHLSRIWTLIVIFQVFSPAKVIFAGIGVLLLVSIPFDSLIVDCDTDFC